MHLIYINPWIAKIHGFLGKYPWISKKIHGFLKKNPWIFRL